MQSDHPPQPPPSDGALVPTESTDALAPRHASSSFLQVVETLAANPEIELDRLRELLKIRDEERERDAHMAYHEALAAFKANPPEVVKNTTTSFDSQRGGHVEYDYADLGSVVAALIPALGAHGLSHHWDVTQAGSDVTVRCYLTHRLGHKEHVELTGPIDKTGSKNDIQAIGSAVSYLQRYTLLSITGIAARGVDDDGNRTAKHRKEGGRNPKAEQQEARERQAKSGQRPPPPKTRDANGKPAESQIPHDGTSVWVRNLQAKLTEHQLKPSLLLKLLGIDHVVSWEEIEKRCRQWGAQQQIPDADLQVNLVSELQAQAADAERRAAERAAAEADESDAAAEVAAIAGPPSLDEPPGRSGRDE